MPFIRTTTTARIEKNTADLIAKAYGQAITLIKGKTEAGLMLSFDGERTMYLGGSDEPCAMVEVQVYGKGDPADYENLTAEITRILSVAFGLSPSRVYVRYEEVFHWGCGGHNF